MTPHKQLFRHNPEQGVYGDCFRTAIGCLLDLAPVDVPHFAEGTDSGREALDRAAVWLKHRDLAMFTVAFGGETPVADVLAHMGVMNPGVYYLLSGTSRNGTNHTVVAHGGEIVHDPALDDSGIVGPMDHGMFLVEVLIPLSQKAA